MTVEASRDQTAPITRAAKRRARPRRVPQLSRELSWIEFNARVLHEARDQRNPLLDRVKFLAIFATNLDEFFQVRISGLRRAVVSNRVAQLFEGAPPSEQVAEVRRRVLDLVDEQATLWRKIRRELARQGVEIVDYRKVAEHHTELRERFIAEIYPVLTPLAVDPGHPFPYISSLTLSVAVGLRDPATDERRFARVKVPAVLPRLIELPPRRASQAPEKRRSGKHAADKLAVDRHAVENLVPDAPASHRFVLLDQVIEANLDLLFSGMDVVERHLFRVTRDADLALDDDDADDILEAIEEELRRRRFGEPVRLEVERSMPAETRELLREGLDVAADEIYEIRGMLDMSSLWQIAELDRPDLKSIPWTPVVPARLAPPDEDEPADVFAVIRHADVLVHHPYESFTGSVERLLEQAADDPDVLAIKQTLYRTSLDSRVVNHLIRAAESGKQVVVLVEIKARFDEQANIEWAKHLERAGAHVVYGFLGLKTHCKTLLIVRREGSTLRRYVHIGTGNYNHKTARTYADLGLLTCRQDIGSDVTDLFNLLTGLSRQRMFRRLIVAPSGMRDAFIGLVDREIDNAKSGRPARIALKMNALVDRASIEALYRASAAGVDVDLIVRGACTLVPQVEGLSEHIRVRSIVGEFLEHSRIWRFENGGEPAWFIGSADLMDRNLDRRIEAFAPVDDRDAQRMLDEILDALLTDDRRAWVLSADGRWQRVERVNGIPGTVDAQQLLKAAAVARSRDAAPPRPLPTIASLEPWV